MANGGDGGDGGMAGPGGAGAGAGWKGQGPQGGASAAVGVPPKFAASLLMEEMEQIGDDMEGESCGRCRQVGVSVLTR